MALTNRVAPSVLTVVVGFFCITSVWERNNGEMKSRLWAGAYYPVSAQFIPVAEGEALSIWNLARIIQFEYFTGEYHTKLERSSVLQKMSMLSPHPAEAGHSDRYRDTPPDGFLQYTVQHEPYSGDSLDTHGAPDEAAGPDIFDLNARK